MRIQADLKDQDQGNRWIALAVCLQVLLVGIKNMLIQAFPDLYEDNYEWNIVLFGVVGVAYVLAYVSLGRRMISFSPLSLALVAFVAISVALSALLHPHGLVRYGELFSYLLPFGLLTAFIITRMTTLEWIAYYMERFAYIIIGVALVCVIAILTIGHTTTSEWSTYSMSLSNVIMVGVIWLLYRYFESQKWPALVGAFAGIAAILLCGSRSPLLAIVAYVVVKTVIKVVSKSTPNRERWIYVIWSALMILFFLFFEVIVGVADYLLAQLGIYSRSIGLLESDLFFDSGRSQIHERLIAEINKSPILGLGIGGDMEIIDWAAHNFYLSVLSTYGYLVGILLLAVFAVMLIRAFRHSRGTNREILLLYTCLFLPRSFTGNDIWRSDTPWWLLAIVIVILTGAKETGERVAPLEPAEEAEACATSGGEPC